MSIVVNLDTQAEQASIVVDDERVIWVNGNACKSLDGNRYYGPNFAAALALMLAWYAEIDSDSFVIDGDDLLAADDDDEFRPELLTSKSVAEITAFLDDPETNLDRDALEALLAAEVAGKNRAGFVSAVQAKLE